MKVGYMLKLYATVTFSGVMEYIIICSLTTCRVTAADDLTTFPQLSLGLKAVSSTSTPGAASNVYSSTPTRLWFGPASQLRRLPSHNNSINVNQCVVKPVTIVRDLGVWFDAERSMRSHVSRVAQTCFYNLRRIRAFRRQLGHDVTARLYSTCPVFSRLLQRRASQVFSFHAGTIQASPARNGTQRSVSQSRVTV